MSLMEVTVALSIMGLVMALALSSLGPWIGASQRASKEAAFWRALGPAQMVLSEISVGAVDPAHPPIIEPAHAQWRAYAARIAPKPLDVSLSIRHDPSGDVLSFSADAAKLHSDLLTGAPPLRFAAHGDNRGLSLEARLKGRWTPVWSGAFPVNAPLVCAFDSISRDCR